LKDNSQQFAHCSHAWCTPTFYKKGDDDELLRPAQGLDSQSIYQGIRLRDPRVYNLHDVWWLRNVASAD
jgi:hypothetical protein